MKLEVTSRRGDDIPQLQLDAECEADKDVLNRLVTELDRALDDGRIAGVAGNFNSCGRLRESGTKEKAGKIVSLSVNLLLGVHPSDIPLLKDGGFKAVWSRK